MKDLVDYIKYHGYITSIRDKVDKDYIWFDICQKELYKDKNGEDKNNYLLDGLWGVTSTPVPRYAGGLGTWSKNRRG